MRRAASWARVHLFGSVASGLATLLLLAILLWAGSAFFGWAVLDAVWHAEDMRGCRAAGDGACWAFIREKWRFILFGRYPYEQQWRPAVTVFLLTGATGLSMVPRLWGRWLLVFWPLVLAASSLLMLGGLAGLPYVSDDLWSGLPVTLILSLFSMVLAFPLAVLLALGRRSRLPVLRLVSTGFIELVRGIPLLTVLFMASLLLPLFLPPGFVIDKPLRALVGLTLFLAAYQAEDVRAGLQALPRGQSEAADALGLGHWQKLRFVILPQAITAVIPPLVGNLIGDLKNTSLVSIISLFDLMQTTTVALADPHWRGLTAEAYFFTASIYFIACFAMSRYSQWLERRLARGRR